MHKMGDNSQMRVFFLGMIQDAKRHLQREVICGKNGHKIEGGYKEKS